MNVVIIYFSYSAVLFSSIKHIQSNSRRNAASKKIVNTHKSYVHHQQWLHFMKILTVSQLQTVKSGKSVTQEIKRLRFHRRRDLFIYIAKFLIWFTAPLTLRELHFQSSLWTITRCRSKRSLKSLPQICSPERPWNSPLSTSQPICPGFHTVPVRLECSPRSGLSLLLCVGSSAPHPR